jgi:catechol 2,3-dioxygenase-like lactoylglutathione lyase family enzyme
LAVFDHVHLSAPNQAKAVAWYIKYLGARPGATPERALLGERLWVIFYKAAYAKPSSDSVIDALGFSFPKPDLKVRELQAAGARLIAPGLVEDPFGVRITIQHDPEAAGFEYVHLRVPDPDKALAWYLDTFGGEQARFGGRAGSPAGLKYGQVWLLADAGGGTPSAGHAIDHIAWRTTGLDAKVAALKATGVVFSVEPRQFNDVTRISFLEGPAGTRIELLERT